MGDAPEFRDQPVVTDRLCRLWQHGLACRPGDDARAIYRGLGGHPLSLQDRPQQASAAGGLRLHRDARQVFIFQRLDYKVGAAAPRRSWPSIRAEAGAPIHTVLKTGLLLAAAQPC